VVVGIFIAACRVSTGREPSLAACGAIRGTFREAVGADRTTGTATRRSRRVLIRAWGTELGERIVASGTLCACGTGRAFAGAPRITVWPGPHPASPVPFAKA